MDGMTGVETRSTINRAIEVSSLIPSHRSEAGVLYAAVSSSRVGAFAFSSRMNSRIQAG